MASTDPDEAFRMFTTTVGLITTNGRRGPNVMAAEWTFNVSYDPFLISVHIAPGEATHDAIVETGEFGVSLVGEDQRVAMAFAGHFSRHEVDKLSSEVFETYPAKRIKVPMIRGCLLNAECKLVQRVRMGDHTAFVGEVVEFSLDSSRSPVVLNRGAHRLGARVKRPLAIAVAATPANASRGSIVAADGELTAARRAIRTIRVSIEDGEGNPIASGTGRTDPRRYFHAELTIPKAVRAGAYTLVARYRTAEGRARLSVA